MRMVIAILMTETPENEGIYSGFARGYDLVMKDVDYPLWAQYVLDLLEHYQINGRRILNLACGTGSTEAVWAKAGYKVTGIDQSATMIEEAIRKNPDLPHTTFQVGDMRTLDLHEEYDFVFCLYDSLNYLTHPRDVQSCFEGVARHLRSGGGFIFDVATEANILENFTNTTYSENFEDFAYIWENEYNIKTKICRSDFYFFLRMAGEQVFTRSHEVHYQRIYTNRELLRWLREAGFEFLGSYDGFTWNAPEAASERIHFVARKK